SQSVRPRRAQCPRPAPHPVRRPHRSGPAPSDRRAAQGPADAEAAAPSPGPGLRLPDLAGRPHARLPDPPGGVPGRPDLHLAGRALAAEERGTGACRRRDRPHLTGARARAHTLTVARAFSILTLLIRFFSTSTTV